MQSADYDDTPLSLLLDAEDMVSACRAGLNALISLAGSCCDELDRSEICWVADRIQQQLNEAQKLLEAASAAHKMARVA